MAGWSLRLSWHRGFNKITLRQGGFRVLFDRAKLIRNLFLRGKRFWRLVNHIFEGNLFLFLLLVLMPPLNMALELIDTRKPPPTRLKRAHLALFLWFLGLFFLLFDQLEALAGSGGAIHFVCLSFGHGYPMLFQFFLLLGLEASLFFFRIFASR